ncbi:pilus assembly FimT family protein [Psychromonas algicola]
MKRTTPKQRGFTLLGLMFMSMIIGGLIAWGVISLLGNNF